MRILWHGIAPWQPTGYGQQCGLWCKRLKAAGHEVAISTQGGSSACDVVEWQGIPVFPSANEIAATGLVFQYYLQSFKPDLVIVLYDGWQMGAGAILRPWKTLAWMPIDTSTTVVGNQNVGGTGVLDLKWLRESGAIPVAMSQHGQRMLRHAGYDPPLIPHGIDLDKWPVRSDEDRAETRKQLRAGPDTFLVGINGTNIDPHRKSFPEQMLAFARFHAKHPDSGLHLHSMIHLPGSIYLDKVAARGCGLGQDVVAISNQGAMYTGSFPQEHLADWYNAMDVMLNCSKGEGFGLVAVEAMACGTPVINTDAHTGPELVGPGWLVGSQPFWNWTHESWWAAPSIPDMEDALQDAFSRARSLRGEARAFAERFSADEVWPLWEKLLAEYE